MLTFEEKQAIIESFPQLTKKEISLKRLNYHFEDSLYEKTVVVEKLHPNGNAFVFVGDMPQYADVAQKSMVNVREFTEAQLRQVITDALNYLAEDVEVEETWKNAKGDELTVLFDGRSWHIYHGENLEEVFGTYDAAKMYLAEERFKKA